MESDVLYEKGRIKITYLHSPEIGKENEVISGEEHELWIKDETSEWNRYIIQRGILRELSGTAEKNPSGLVNIMDRINPDIFGGVKREGIALGDVSKAFIGAYQKEKEDFKKYLAKQEKI